MDDAVSSGNPSYAESPECGDEKEPSVHDERCALSLRDPKTCKCSCGGSLHGSAWMGTVSNRLGAHGIHSRPRKAGRIVTIAVAVAVTGTVGGLAITGNFNESANGSNNLSVNVDLDLNKAVGSLSSLRFGGRQISSLGISGASHPTDCAQSATGQVRQFLTRYPCKQFATSIWTITRQGATAQVVFSWVEMPTTSLAGQYKIVVDTYRTGNPPGIPATFNGRCYASGQQDSTVWTVEVQPTGKLNIDRMILQAAAQSKLSPDYLGKHCVI
jgi:hypothetical protein